MSTKNKRNRQLEAQGAAPEARPADAVTLPDAQPQPSQPSLAAESRPAPQDRKYLFIFWGLIALAAASAWILAILMPSVSESVIERWIMAALAASLAVFLFFYK